MTYDALRRRESVRVSTAGGAAVVRSHIVYGEAFDPAVAQSRNLLGQIYQTYDAAGVSTAVRYGFDEQAEETRRRLRIPPAAAAPPANWSSYAAGADWSALLAAGDLAALEAAAAAGLEAETFSTVMAYDALGRPVEMTEVTTPPLVPAAPAPAPDAMVTRYRYDEAGLLDGVALAARGAAAQEVVAAIDYDAEGRRTRIELGNGTETTYTYDEHSRRLMRLQSTRSNGSVVQDLGYAYDAGGNIVELTDGAQATVYFGNYVVSPNRLFEYDGLQRLVRAEGRCHPGQQPTAALPPQRVVPEPNSATVLQRYAQTYEYDGVGNLLEMRQTRGGPRWHRRYQYALDSNRLIATSTPDDGTASEAPDRFPDYVGVDEGRRYLQRYVHDVHGNMVAAPGLAISSRPGIELIDDPAGVPNPRA